MKPFYENEISFGRFENTLSKIKDRIYTKIAELDVEYSISKEPVIFENRLDAPYKKISVGEKWGELWDCAWFHFTYHDVLPDSASGKKLVLLLDINGEGCLFDNNGVPIRGITTVNSQFDYSLGGPGKRVVPFVDKAKGNEQVDLWVDAGCNDLFGNDCGGRLKQAEIAVCDEKMREIFYDFIILFDLLKILNRESARYSSLLNGLYKVSQTLVDFTDNELEICSAILKEHLNRKSGDTGLTITATGHSHLDLAWLWPIRETKRKAARTFSTAIEMINRYPDYIFGASQPQQFEWVKEYYPELYNKIKQKVEDGRIELQGAMWVEPDLNVSGGESLVRQIIIGKKFWKKEFNKDVDIAHIPDVFGFNAALPQILHKSGVNRLLTIKMSWNRYNQFPYHTFIWEGIDKSKILVHMPPEGTYNSCALPRAVDAAEKKYIDKGVCNEALLLYGIGDGGGGPSTEHLESLKRIKSLNGISPVKSGTTKEFFDRIEKNKDSYQLYRGEMYLEKHQGTYTSQARNKYYNRRLERLLYDAELLCTIAYKQKGMDYPSDILKKIWKEVLLYQFHDILPGSSIKRVYDESIARYLELEKDVLELIEKSLSCFEKSDKYVFNPLKFGSEEAKLTTGKAVCEANTLENDFIKVIFNENGEIISLYNKKLNRESLSGISNIMKVFEDHGDAWDMEEGYLTRQRNKFTIQNTNSYVKDGVAYREQVLVYNKSTLTQKFILKPDEEMVSVDNHIDWQERDRFLKAEFVPDINCDFVNCNIQFGNLKRSTKKNNPYEFAQNEICSHKYIDMSEGNFGFAILNDCKYGYHVKDNTILMSLFRSQNYPGVEADKGEHDFRFALYPHQNCFECSDVVEKSYAFNTNTYNGYKIPSFVNIDSSSVMIESIKKAEDSDAVVIRLYESKGLHNTCNLQPSFKFNKIYQSTIDEKYLGEISNVDNKLSLTFKPYEIQTIIFE